MALLTMHNAWERFVEDCTVSFLCGRLRCDGKSIPCYLVTKLERDAKRIITQENRYLAWTSADVILRRWQALFPQPNQLESALNIARAELDQLVSVRNAIAHSSDHSHNQFLKTVQAMIGGNPDISRPARLLMRQYPKDPAKTIFEKFADTLEITAIGMVG